MLKVGEYDLWIRAHCPGNKWHVWRRYLTSQLVESARKRTSYAKLTNEDLREELAKQITLTAVALLRAAEIWSELQRRGVDMSALKSGLGQYLSRISRRELAAEAVVAFAGQRKILQHLSGMPLEAQRRYAAGEQIDLAEHDDFGRIIQTTRKLGELTGREIVVALDQGRVRSLTEQKSQLSRQMNEPTRVRRREGSTAQVAARGGLLHIGRVRLDPLDLTLALGALGFELVRKDDG